MSSCTLSIFQASDSVTLTLIFPETIIHVCFPDLQCSLPGTTEFRVQLGLIGDVSKLAIGDNPSRKIYNVPVFEDSRSRQIASGMTEREYPTNHYRLGAISQTYQLSLLYEGTKINFNTPIFR